MTNQEAAKLLRDNAYAEYGHYGAMEQASRLGAEALELMEWYDKNPYAIGYAMDRKTGEGNWTYRHGPLKGSTDAASLLDALRAAWKAAS